MLIPSGLVARGPDSAMPQACQPFSLHSNVCIGDLIAIVACSIAGIGFFFWAIHVICKMCRFPFNRRSEVKEKPNEETERVDPYHVPSAFDNSLLVQRGVIQTPSIPKRVRTRLTLSEPEEEFHKSSTPIPSDTYFAQGVMTTPRAPRLPPPAGGQSRKSPSHRSGRRASGSPTRGGAYGEGYEYGANGEYISDVSPSRARGSPLHTGRSGGGYRSRQSTGRMNGDPTTYAY